MTKERAQYILAFMKMIGIGAEPPFAYSPAPFKHSFIRADGITQQEDSFIRMVWAMMSQDKSYYDALVQIAGTG